MKNNTIIFLCIFSIIISLSSCTKKKKTNSKNTPEKTMEMDSTESGIAFNDFKEDIDGKGIQLYVLKNKSGIEISFTNYGQRLVSLIAPDRNGKLEDIVLGYSTLKEYQSNSGYFGATIGRYGNRIAKGAFEIDGITYDLAKNNNGNHLHGGDTGFESVVWDVDSVSQNFIRFKRTSPDMEEGYPGNLDVSVEYTLTDDNELRIEYLASTDKKTHVNLTHHSFFNLKGEGKDTVNEHIIQIHSSAITAVDNNLIPTGELMPVSGTPFDFNIPKSIKSGLDQDHVQLAIGGGFDHNYVLDHARTNTDGLVYAAKVKEPISGRVLEVFTNEPGIQFYGGNFIDDDLGKKGNVYKKRGAFCLETQHYPDSPNNDSFPSTILEPGQEYNSVCVYKFSVE